ncbi:uncharacterized protein LOC119230069 isoform X1 [Pungitius pungitius]|uniref:uncharacterized protein LOC119230069 isoform X1 n=1 Tax=Pungitius pungitius TaxID=134920 RepID=UPI002E13CE11
MSLLKEAEPGPGTEAKTWAQSLVYTLEELECKICYNRYDTRSRKPKLLGCLHRVCAKCLKKMVDMGESSPSIICCPFCRHETYVPDEEVRLYFVNQEVRLYSVNEEVRLIKEVILPHFRTSVFLSLSSDKGVVDGGRPTHPGCSVLSGPSPRWWWWWWRRRSRRRGGVAESKQSDRWEGRGFVPPVLRLSGHHHHGAPRGLPLLGLPEHAQRRGAVPPPQLGLAALQPADSEVSRLDVPQLPPLPAGGALPGVLQLSASRDLPADDWSAVARRGPGESGPVHAAAARPLRLLSVSVSRADGGVCRAHTCNAVTKSGARATAMTTTR